MTKKEFMALPIGVSIMIWGVPAVIESTPKCEGNRLSADALWQPEPSDSHPMRPIIINLPNDDAILAKATRVKGFEANEIGERMIAEASAFSSELIKGAFKEKDSESDLLLREIRKTNAAKKKTRDAFFEAKYGKAKK
jgi:hypothetical protein